MRAFTTFLLAAVAYATSGVPAYGAATPPAVAAPTYTTPPISTVVIPVYVTTTVKRSTSSIPTPVYTPATSSFTTMTSSVHSNPAYVSSSSAPPAPVHASVHAAPVYSSNSTVHSVPVAPYPVSSTSAVALPTGKGAPATSSTPVPFIPNNRNAAGALQISFGGLAAVAGLATYFL